MLIIILGVLSDSEKDFINRIYQEHNVKLFHISFKILRSRSDAEEAVSQAFLNIIDHIEKISKLPCPQIAPYCVVIVKNESINILRRKKKEACFDELDYLEHDAFLDADEKLYAHLNTTELCKAVSQLSNEDRYFIQLRFAHKMGYGEIARLIGVSDETAKKRGQRVLKKLRSLYEEGENNVQHV